MTTTNPMTMTIRVVCDAARRPCAEVKVGAGWARISVYHQGPLTELAPLRPYLAMARAMLHASRFTPSEIRLAIDGPDRGSVPAEILKPLLAEWSSVLNESQGAPTRAAEKRGPVHEAMQPAQAAPALEGGDIESLARLGLMAVGASMGPKAAGRSSDAGNLLATMVQVAPGLLSKAVDVVEDAVTASATVPSRPDAKGDAARRALLVEQMVQTVRSHAKQLGAHPNFSDPKPGAVAKAHNYIKSVTGRQTASAEVLEEVRVQLIE